MTGPWKPFDTYLLGIGHQYIAGRVLDTTKPVLISNIEYNGDYEANKEVVIKLCEKLNAE